MKYVIDIPDNEYKQNRHYYDSVYHGTPFNDVIEEYVERGATTENMIMLKNIEDIKKEIIHYNDIHCNSEFISVGTVFEIIDKHIGKKKE